MNRYKDWIEQAERDMGKAKLDVRHGYYDWACFTSQQSAEKAAKALCMKLDFDAWGHSITNTLKLLNETAIRIKQENSELIDIRLFGSVAKKEDTGKSDVDVIIIVSDSSEDIFNRSLKFRRYFDIQVPLDVLVYTEPEIEQMIKEGNYFIENILNKSISLIAKTS